LPGGLHELAHRVLHRLDGADEALADVAADLAGLAGMVRKRWFGCTPNRAATALTVAPGRSVSATACAFTSSGQRRCPEALLGEAGYLETTRGRGGGLTPSYSSKSGEMAGVPAKAL